MFFGVQLSHLKSCKSLKWFHQFWPYLPEMRWHVLVHSQADKILPLFFSPPYNSSSAIIFIVFINPNIKLSKPWVVFRLPTDSWQFQGRSPQITNESYHYRHWPRFACLKSAPGPSNLQNTCCEYSEWPRLPKSKQSYLCPSRLPPPNISWSFKTFLSRKVKLNSFLRSCVLQAGTDTNDHCMRCILGWQPKIKRCWMLNFVFLDLNDFGLVFWTSLNNASLCWSDK